MCPNCTDKKTEALTRTKCKACGGWRLLSQDEQAKVAKRKR